MQNNYPVCKELILCKLFTISRVENDDDTVTLIEPLPFNQDLVCTIFIYGKCSKIPNYLLFFLSNKIVLKRAEINRILVTIGNREDPKQTASLDRSFLLIANFQQ